MDASSYFPFPAAALILPFILLLITLILGKNPAKTLPPGPSLIPLFFSTKITNLATQPHKALAKLATTYGPIMTLQLGSVTSIVVSSSSLAKQILLKSDPDHFSTPFVLDAVYARQHHQHSVAWLPSASPQWRALRRIYGGLILSSRNLDASAALRREKVANLLDHLRGCALGGVAVDIGQAALGAFFEIMLSANFSRDLGGQKPGEIKELILAIIKETGTLNLVDWFPVLHMADPQGIRRRLTALCEKLFRVFDEIIDSRLKMRKTGADCSSSNKDVLDILLDVMVEQKDGIGREFVLHTLLDLFGAGMDTTSKGIEWTMAELLNNPRALQKTQEELNKIVGKGKVVEESDLSKLTYFHAVMKEAFRLHPPAPLLLPRKIDEEVDVVGYSIPKGARMVVNVWAIGRDPNIWAKPNLFSPERFLDSKVDLKGQHFELIPFGAGRRICPGMPLALRAVPVVLASIINCFDWKIEKGVDHAKDLDMQDKILITLRKVKPLRAIPICCV